MRKRLEAAGETPRLGTAAPATTTGGKEERKRPDPAAAVTIASDQAGDRSPAPRARCGARP